MTRILRADKVLPELSSRAPWKRRRRHDQVLVTVRDGNHKRVEIINIGLVFEHGPAVTKRHADALETTIEALREQAMANLRAASTPAHWTTPEGTELLIYQAPDRFAAERLLILPELIDPWPFGGVFAATPAVGALICLPTTGLSSVEAIQLLAHIADVRSDAEDGITSQLFWHDGKTCHPVFIDNSKEEATEVLMPPKFQDALAAMATLSLVSTAAEA